MCIVVCALFLPQNSSVYRHLCSTKGYFDPWTNGGMKISLFCLWWLLKKLKNHGFLNALLKDFILLFCIITHSSSSFKNIIIVPWKLLAIAWRGVVLFHSVYFPIQVVLRFSQLSVYLDVMHSCHNHIWYGHPTTGFNKLRRGTTTVKWSPVTPSESHVLNVTGCLSIEHLYLHWMYVSGKIFPAFLWIVFIGEEINSEFFVSFIAYFLFFFSACGNAKTVLYNEINA